MPCPFCGGSVKASQYAVDDDGHTKWAVGCDCNNAPEDQPYAERYVSAHGFTREEAVAAWNRRTGAPQAQPDARAWLVQEFNHDGVLRSEFAVVGDQPWSGERGADQITTQPLYLSAPAADDGWRDMANGDWPDDGSLFQTCIWRGQPWTQQHQQWEAPQTACYRAFHPNAPGKVQLRDKDGKPIHATHWRALPAPPLALHPAAPTDEVGKT